MRTKPITIEECKTLKSVLQEINWAMIFEPNLGHAHDMLEKVINDLRNRPTTTGEDHD